MGNPEQGASKSQLFYAAVWVLITFSLVAVTQLVGITEAAGDDGLQLTDSIDFPLVGADPAATNLPSVRYGGLMWSRVDVRVSPAQGILGRSVVEVDLKVANTLHATTLRAPADMVRLARVGSSGEAIVGRLTEVGRRLSLEPGESRLVTAEFEVGSDRAPDPRRWELRIGEPTRTPAIVPLVGEVGVAEYPILTAVDDTALVVADPDQVGRKVVVQAEAVALDVNAGPYRAADGGVLALAKVNVQSVGGSVNPGYLTSRFWGLQNDQGDVVEPILVAKGERSGPSSDEITLLFVLDNDPASLVLLAGLGADQAQIQIAIPRVQ